MQKNFFIFVKKYTFMKKETRGRKPLPAGEKKKAIQFYVKQKHYKSAKEEVKIIEKKYN